MELQTKLIVEEQELLSMLEKQFNCEIPLRKIVSLIPTTDGAYFLLEVVVKGRLKIPTPHATQE